jgi:hypothetical protein
MAGWDEVAAIAGALPAVEEGTSYGNRAWKVDGKLFAWERPLRKKEIEQLGDAAPEGEILGVRVSDEEAKQALLSSRPEIYFTTPHFDGHRSVLILLDHIPRADLEEAITDAYFTVRKRGGRRG